MKRSSIGALALLVGALASGCISTHAGYDRTSSLVRSRIGSAPAPSTEDASVGKTRMEVLGKPLTADSVVRLAVVSSPAVQAAFNKLGMEREGLIRAVRLPNPRLEGGVQFFPDQTKIELGATVSLTELVMIAWREQAASQGMDAAVLEAAGSTLDVALEARLAFYDAQAKAGVFRVQKTATYTAAQSARLARDLGDAGNITDLTRLREEAFYDELRLSLDRAEVDATIAREALAAALGLFGDEGDKMVLDGTLPEPDASVPSLEEVERRAIDKSLELEAYRLRYGQAAADTDLAHAEGVVPDVEAGVTATREDEAWGYGPKVEVSLPLFYQGQAEVARSEARMREARSSILTTAVRIRAAARTLVARVLSARDRATFYRNRVLPMRAKLLDETLRQYNAMNATPFEVLVAKRDQLQAERGRIEALRDYWSARAELDLLLAGRTPRTTLASHADEPASSPSQGAPGH